MNISISKTYIIGIVLMVAMGVMMFGSGVKAAEQCTLRASISSGEVEKIAPGVENLPAYTDSELPSGTPLTTIDDSGNVKSGTGTLCAYSSIKYLASLLRLIVIVVAGVMFVVAGLLYATSAENEDRRKTAKNILVFGVIGVFVALIASVFPSIAASFM